jgi:hypothetical protein
VVVLAEASAPADALLLLYSNLQEMRQHTFLHDQEWQPTA